MASSGGGGGGGGVMEISKLDLNTEAEEESKTIEDKSAGKSETTIDDDELKSPLEDDESIDDVYIQLFKDCGFEVCMEGGQLKFPSLKGCCTLCSRRLELQKEQEEEQKEEEEEEQKEELLKLLDYLGFFEQEQEEDQLVIGS